MDIRCETICRICLKNSSELQNIFNDGLDQYIMAISVVKVNPNDGLPQYICKTCTEELNTAIRFKEKCENSYSKFHEYANSLTTQIPEQNVEYFESKISNEIYENITIFALHDPSDILIVNTVTSSEENFEVQTLYECASCKKQNPAPVCENCSPTTLSPNEIKSDDDTKEISNIIGEEVDNKEEKVIKPKSKSRKKHQCDYCGKIFNFRTGLIQHLSVHSNKRPFSCKECGKAFRLKSFLSKHLLSHSNIRNHYCPHCGKSFALKSNMIKHLEVHTGDKKFHCSVCDKKFKTSRSLQYHLKLHTGERDFPCSKCDKAFVNKFDLKRHEQRHEKYEAMKEGKKEQKPKNHQCEACGVFYPSLSDLLRHFRVHSGDKPHKCQYCEKSFIGLGGLTVHVRTHTGAKPFKCQYCDQCFSQTSNLKVHLRLHTGETPYVCDFCNKGYNRKRDLDAHVKKHFVDNVG